MCITLQLRGGNSVKTKYVRCHNIYFLKAEYSIQDISATVLYYILSRQTLYCPAIAHTLCRLLKINTHII
jgi:hypothetical protein